MTARFTAPIFARLRRKRRLPFVAATLLWASAALGAPSAEPLNRVDCEQAFLDLAESQGEASAFSLKSLRSDHAIFDGIDAQDNEAFIALAKRANRGQSDRPLIFFDVESAFLKQLNDRVVQDKDLVTALTNLYKSLFWGEVKNDPILSPTVLAQYSDFKSIRLAIPANRPELSRQLARAFERANAVYEKDLHALGASEFWEKDALGLAKRIGNWHLSGTGQSPDEAGLAARYSRTVSTLERLPQVRGFDEARDALVAKAWEVERLRTSMGSRLDFVSGVLVETANGKKTLSAETIETILKASSYDPSHPRFLEAIQTAFRARFRYWLPREDASLLLRYIQAADQFSPGIYVEKRVVINLGQATQGILSADFKGQNSKNIEQTLRALAETVDAPLVEQIRAVRHGEEVATRHLEARKKSFDAAVEATFGPRARAEFSGDDGIFMPQEPLTDLRKREFLTQLLAQAPPKDFRIAFVPVRYSDSGNAVHHKVRSRFVVEAEQIEKELRKELIHKLTREELNDTLIAVELIPAEHEAAEVNLYVMKPAGSPPLSIDSAEFTYDTRIYLKGRGYRLGVIARP